ncbi:MAG TPA: FtsX-like permease family protein, partial [Longimicrobiales bacterium]|nr:FtsX-like permease family protein [Longimicrobiales bacterium]
IRLMLTESALLSVVGGTVGLGLGWLGLRAMKGMTRLGIEGATGVAVDHRVVLFVMGAAAASGMLFGFVPALRSSGATSHEALKEGGRAGSAGGRGASTVNALVVAEVALALMLVVGAGLMVRSSWLLRAVDPGFATEGTLAVRFAVPGRYEGRDAVLAFQGRFLELLEGRPGIERAGRIGWLPLAGTSWSSQFQAEGWPSDRVGLEILHRRADRGYFEALDIPLVRGRLFEPGDGPDQPLVVVVNETFAREHFPGEDPIGQKIAYDRTAAANPEDNNWYEIVGIVGDQSQESPGLPVRAEVFEHTAQDWDREPWIVMRTSVAPLSVVPAVRAALEELDPLVPIAEIRPLREVWRTSMARQDFILVLLSAFGVVALLLAAVGVYGVTAQAARARTREIGIRMALGARASEVVGMMLRRGLVGVAVGLAIGLGASLVATRALTTVLFGVEPTDPGTLGAVVVLLAGVAAIACWLPARRATRVDPVASLRSE